MAIPYIAERQRCERALQAVASHPSWEEADRRWHASLIDRYFNELGRLKQRAANHKASTRPLRDHLLSSYSGAVCGYLQDAYSRGLKKIEPISPAELEKRSRSARPTKPIFDYAMIKAQTKPNGEKRITLSPGRKFRTAQRLVGDVIQAAGVTNPFDFNLGGKGPHAAVAEIIRLVEQEGVRDFVVFDLKNYFASVSTKHLKGVPLPKKVLRHSVLFNRHAILLHHNTAEAEAARHGLPQGARVSGPLASSFLGRELRKLSGAKGIVTYVDDVVIGACDPAGAKSLAEAIKTRFGKHPGGPLGFKKLEVNSIASGFQFLGYYLRLDKLSEKPRVFMKPSHEAEKRFRRKLMQKLGSISPKPQWDEAVAAAHVYGQQWRQSFTLWQPNEAQVEEFEFLVEIFVSDFLSGYTSKHVLPPPVLECVGGVFH